MKRLVVCCDGTWNKPDEVDHGEPAPTNVYRLSLVVAPEDGHGREQRVCYHKGVGTSRFEHIRGGMFGLGLSKSIRDCYSFVVENFDEGDEIFLFGFSRGAYTARSLAGLIRNSGVLRREHADKAGEAFALYRDRDDSTRPGSDTAVSFRTKYSHETRLRFIGVWDTVGALGVPLSGRVAGFLNRRNKFHDTRLSSKVDAAYHACAIDERRKPFRPTLWTRPAQPDPAAEPTTSDVEQVWFAGVHSDVGGGYAPEHGLSDIALTWMIDKAERHGLKVDHDLFGADPYAADTRMNPLPPNELATLHDSFGWIYRPLGKCVRRIGGELDLGTAASSTAVARVAGDDDYRRTATNLVSYLQRPDVKITDVPGS